MKSYLPIICIYISIVFVSCKKHDKENVSPTTSVNATNYVPQKRVYYIAADEVLWDYAPQGTNVFMGMPFSMTDSLYAVKTEKTIGRINYKARYREYTDSTFSVLKPLEDNWKHLGILGPIIRGVVGDSIIIHFKNNASFNTSIHPHGVLYSKSSEGAGYNDGTDGAGTSIAPGKVYTYRYLVRETAGPVQGTTSLQVWLYHSHVDMAESDMYAGLIGGIIITDKAHALPDGRPNDVDREFVTLFMVMDENKSALLDKNIREFCSGVDVNDEDFQEGNKKHSINGMFMGNLPGLVMNKGERVRWYVMALGNEVDLHTPHWHGNTVTINGERTDVMEILPASMKLADMTPDNPGKWAFHCHVTDHMEAGMTALYEVR